jgi:hypothetical protein
LGARDVCVALRQLQEDRRPIDAGTASALTDAVTVLVRDSPNQPAKLAEAIVSEALRHLGRWSNREGRRGLRLSAMIQG